VRHLVVTLCVAFCASAADGHGVGGDDATGAGGDAAQPTLSALDLPRGVTASVWAQGAAVANPVALAIDDHGRCFVARTARFGGGGVIDARGHLYLYADDIRCVSVADRAAMLARWQAKFPAGYFTTHGESVALVADEDGDGVAERATTWADGFADAVTGTAAGVLPLGDEVWFACVPTLWRLADRDGDGAAEAREAIVDGFGVRVGLSGHDLHGLVEGPDGRIWFSVGDRGYDVVDGTGRRLTGVGVGAVFRCLPDGSRLELVHGGLRNPQELAFDAWGDLFTVDNNADLGDASRVVRILPGGDSGWDAGWQLVSNDGFARAAGLDGAQPCAWIEEGVWRAPFAGQPAWFLPPIGHSAAGPSGIAFVPETGWAAQRGRLLVCDYRASPDSGIRSVALRARGAGFALDRDDVFAWGLAASDLAFAPDGRLLVANYLGGWGLADTGRIVALSDGDARHAAVAALLREGMDERGGDELARLLVHADGRVRSRTHRALARRGDDGIRALRLVAASGGPAIARVHAIWGLGIAGRREAGALSALMPLLTDREPRVREQAARVLGDEGHVRAAPALVTALADPEPRVRLFAALGLARLAHRPALPELIALARSDTGGDADLRHATVAALAAVAEGDELAALAEDESRALRLAAALALRRQRDPLIARFLDDAEPAIAAEAVRAIHDLPLVPALPALPAALGAAWIEALPAAAARMIHLRLVDAAHRVGDVGAMRALAGFAASSAPPAQRALALDALGRWDVVAPVDPITGRLIADGTRDARVPLDAAVIGAPVLALIREQRQELLGGAVALAQRFELGLDDDLLLAIADNAGFAEAVRATALVQLGTRLAPGLAERMPRLLVDESPTVRRAAFTALAAIDPDGAITAGRRALAGDLIAPGSAISVHVALADPDRSAAAVGDPASAIPAVASWTAGFAAPHADAGAAGASLPRLTDGDLAMDDDDSERSTWLDGGESRVVIDLGAAADLARVNTWSWHRRERATQRFTLWGADAATMPDPAAPDLRAGWTRIAGVDTSSLGEGGRHVSAVTGGERGIGRFRWLLWQSPARASGTFYGEMAAFAIGAPLPPLARVVVDRGDGAWEDLATGRPTDHRARGATATWIPGFARPHADAGSEGLLVPRLTDGALPADHDDVTGNTWFDGGSARILVDLGSAVEVARVATYSWHRRDRAPHRYTLYGADGPMMPDPAAPDLAGWTRIARVDTGERGDGGKHGSCVLADGGALGRFRWLLWRTADQRYGAFLSELCVYAVGDPAPALRTVDPALEPLQQHALTTLAGIPGRAAAAVIAEQLARLAAGRLPPALTLELTDAAAARTEPEVIVALTAWRERALDGDALAAWRACLTGGDAARGRELFRVSPAQCAMCHAVAGDGGVAAPDLAAVASRLDREQLLRALVDPGAEVAPGYGAVSIMPPMGQILSPRDLRDLVAWLATLR